MNSAPRIATAVAAAVCLALITSCRDERSAEAAGSAAASSPPLVAEFTPAPTTDPTPALPEARFDVRCERVLPVELREKHMYGWPMTESAGTDHTSCNFDEEPFKRITLSIDCRQWNTVEARLESMRWRLPQMNLQEATSPGRLAFVTKEGVPMAFFDDDTDCEVTTVWVGWNEPESASIARIHAVAEALTAASIAR